jgi:hypothetical protein
MAEIVAAGFPLKAQSLSINRQQPWLDGGYYLVTYDNVCLSTVIVKSKTPRKCLTMRCFADRMARSRLLVETAMSGYTHRIASHT